ncbi:DUF4349 domain-containing protein [Candidatus Cryosericum septentrionale]|jgi:hypothetical protein|uniref:DUF4349 domain-containing protein n=1 Tax=Candidatus Cryosericum septentrionale TaxID=2290913 RepID=A0A398DMZ1_9BACT|nr:DUF4349 domain-containing protein [Candidatus Cryosericum septentrionale]RIE16982.1 DUF4349 domain-containing protein [Candidatus Cryosericum septentrionale]
MTQSLRVRRFLALIVVVAVVAMAVTGCAKRSAVSPEPGVATSGGVLKGLPAGTSGTSSSAPASTTTGDQQALTDRKIIFNASLSLDVVDAEKAFSNCEILVVKYGGFVAQSSLQKSASQVLATVVLRVPAAKATQLMNDLAGLGTVTSRSSGSDDVTSQYIDIQARLKVLRAEEEQLVGFLKKATNIKDMLAVQEQLGSVRTQIEQYEGQQRYMDNATSLATVTAQLVQTTEVFVAPRGFGSAFVQSLARFGHGLAAFWTWLGGSAVFIVFYGLLIWALVWIVLRLRQHRSHRSLPPQN